MLSEELRQRMWLEQSEQGGERRKHQAWEATLLGSSQISECNMPVDSPLKMII